MTNPPSKPDTKLSQLISEVQADEVTLASLGSQLSTLQAAFTALTNTLIASGILPTPPYNGPALLVVKVGPTQQFATPAAGIQALADGGTMYVDAGTYTTPFNIPQGFTNITIQGAGAYQTIFNGQGGVGAGHRLSWGKGFIHTQSPVVINDISFNNCGGADGVGDGEAGIYAELFTVPATVTVNHCAFDGNENGLFVPSYMAGQPGLGINVVLNNCDFGYVTSNGQSKDGLSHDFYINSLTLAVNNCNFYGNSYGHNMKSRAQTMTVAGGFVAHNAGRALERPDGGSLAVSNLTITSLNGANANMIGYCDESTLNGVFDTTFDSCIMICARYQDTVWVASGTMTFTNVQQSWVQYAGVPPSISFTGSGSLVGLVLTPPTGTQFSNNITLPPSAAKH